MISVPQYELENGNEKNEINYQNQKQNRQSSDNASLEVKKLQLIQEKNEELQKYLQKREILNNMEGNNLREPLIKNQNLVQNNKQNSKFQKQNSQQNFNQYDEVLDDESSKFSFTEDQSDLGGEDKILENQLNSKEDQISYKFQNGNSGRRTSQGNLQKRKQSDQGQLALQNQQLNQKQSSNINEPVNKGKILRRTSSQNSFNSQPILSQLNQREQNNIVQNKIIQNEKEDSSEKSGNTNENEIDQIQLKQESQSSNKEQDLEREDSSYSGKYLEETYQQIIRKRDAHQVSSFSKNYLKDETQAPVQGQNIFNQENSLNQTQNQIILDSVYNQSDQQKILSKKIFPLHSNQQSYYEEDKDYFVIVKETVSESRPYCFLFGFLHMQTLFVFPALSIFLRVYQEKFMKDWGDIIMLMIGASSIMIGRIIHFFKPMQTPRNLLLLLFFRFVFYPFFILQAVFTAHSYQSFILTSWCSIVSIILFMISHGYAQDMVKFRAPEIMKEDSKWKNYIGFVLIQTGNFGQLFGSLMAICFVVFQEY